MPSLLLEIEHGRNNGIIIAGTDEAGRGPLAGPVVAAAVIIPENFPADLANAINDSKKLSEKKRAQLFPAILETCIHGIAECSAQEIDKINILQASLLAMKKAVDTLVSCPRRRASTSLLSSSTLLTEKSKFVDARLRGHDEFRVHTVLVDGNKSPNIPNMKNIPIIKGDSKSLSIAAASILAKVTRDRLMQQLHREFPYYGWDHNAGYPTAEHLRALNEHGITSQHRQSFSPVRAHISAAQKT